MNTTEIGKYIKEQLKIKKYTQENLADHLGISKQAVSQNLSGKSTFEISNLMLIAEFLDVSVDEILYAGTKRETLLCKFYNQKTEDMVFEKLPEQPDSIGNTLFDYCLLDDNVHKFEHFYKNQVIIETLYNDIRFVAFLIRNNQVKYLQSRFRTPVRNEKGEVVSYKSDQLIIPSLSDRAASISVGRRTESIYANLTEIEKLFVDAVFSCKKEEILALIPELRFNQRNRSKLTRLVLVAIEKDNLDILNFYMTKNKMRPTKELFDLAVNYNSMTIAKHLYDESDSFELKTVENLLKIDDRSFVQERITSMKLNKHQMSKGIVDAVKANDLLAVKSLINIVDEKSLSLALEQANFDEGIEVARALLEAGAEFSVINVYDSKSRINLPSVTSAIKHLLRKVEDGED